MSTLPPYPIQLEQLVFLRCSVEAVPGHAPGADEAPVAPENTISVKPDPDNPQRFFAHMRTVINLEMDKRQPYAIDMECLAALITDADSLSPEDALKGATLNGHSICYGAIRETVAWLTGRQPYGPLLLGLSVLHTKPPPGAQAATDS